ncbi:laccase, multicopper oxidase, benzenediol:oxygen oxidorectuctase [Didymosphaeria variabile]|uniref:laccase n=1 Tax=Didymosphaeria variabile TaxID=1932322 RepID=A0A9W8XCT5_9PLEO|nr:laccase, multicopper oxidase, benzenediol:oxygen oxidorectuctase [Didymosphaeria variabile]KAJ4347053.1 laccase, multicopper oxidase, benzenediol:oxygen oxidorectuctase [Didymosphaeria variabile]
MPGPTIIGNWGDTFEITIRNKMQHNGTSFHWHGLRQLHSNTEDGVNGITECALAPGDTKTYRFRATEYGTSWYHSHFSAQYGDGTFGTILINGPATADYDVDLGTYTVQDWYYLTAYQAAARAQAFSISAPPPSGDNVLVNGTNKKGSSGEYNKVKIQTDKKYRLRLVNPSIDIAVRVSLDGHPFTVIANDFVPVEPYDTNYVLIGIGQRYDVIFTANQTADNYWFRADPHNPCVSFNGGAGRAIFTYDNVTVADPTSNANSGAPTTCEDPSPKPKIAKNVPKDTFRIQAQDLPVAFDNRTVNTNNESIVLWTINGTSMMIDPAEPTLEYMAKGKSDYPRSYNLIEISESAAWTYWVIQQAVSAPNLPHPIHLHGHDMYVLGTGSGQFDVDTHLDSLVFTNPPRRDVHHLPAGGWLVIAYPTDNPGAWLMHCHIAFHVAMGLSVQFVERESEIILPAQNSEWFNTCNNYENYVRNKPVYPQDDSGLKKRWPPVLEYPTSPALM